LVVIDRAHVIFTRYHDFRPRWRPCRM